MSGVWCFLPLTCSLAPNEPTRGGTREHVRGGGEGCSCVRNPGGHAESSPRPYEEGVSFYHVPRPLDQVQPSRARAGNHCEVSRDATCACQLRQFLASSRCLLTLVTLECTCQTSQCNYSCTFAAPPTSLFQCSPAYSRCDSVLQNMYTYVCCQRRPTYACVALSLNQASAAYRAIRAYHLNPRALLRSVTSILPFQHTLAPVLARSARRW